MRKVSENGGAARLKRGMTKLVNRVEDRYHTGCNSRRNAVAKMVRNHSGHADSVANLVRSACKSTMFSLWVAAPRLAAIP